MILSLGKYKQIYQAIQMLSTQKNYPVSVLCEIAGINRSGYYKWIHRKKSQNEILNEDLLTFIHESYEESDGVLGYRQMAINIFREKHIKVNCKRVYRLMKISGLKSVCRKKRYHYIKSTPEIVAENILNRNFKAEHSCQKWLTDVTEFKYGNGEKAYLSAILDLGDRSIVSYVISHSNNNALVFDTFDLAVSAHPEAKPIFHSDRGFQYTSKKFRAKLDTAGMIQSMSRVGRCLDNGPMEGFWGILKSEMYYLHKFKDYESLKDAIESYIDYYNTRRYQKRLRCMTPMEYRKYLSDAAA